MSIEIHKDPIAEKLDELADLAEYWKKNRAKGIHPNGVKAGMMALIDEIKALNSFDLTDAFIKVMAGNYTSNL